MRVLINNTMKLPVSMPILPILVSKFGRLNENGYTGARYRSGYTTFDLRMTYNFNKNTMLNLAVLNITDETGPAVNDKGGNWVVDEGRRYWANIKYSF